jgi:hypothetical protein
MIDGHDAAPVVSLQDPSPSAQDDKAPRSCPSLLLRRRTQAINAIPIAARPLRSAPAAADVWERRTPES